jgi:hypothetical protein
VGCGVVQLADRLCLFCLQQADGKRDGDGDAATSDRRDGRRDKINAERMMSKQSQITCRQQVAPTMETSLNYGAQTRAVPVVLPD